MLRRIIAMLLVIVVLMGNVPVQAFAAEDQPQATEACITEGCTFGAGHTGECSTFVACGTEGCTYASGHEGNCSNYVAPQAALAADAVISVTVSNRGQLAVACEEVTVSDRNTDGRLSLDEALYAVHTAFGKGYASVDGTVTKLWDVDTTNVSFFVNHRVASSDVSAETVGSGDYLVASVDRDETNDYDKYSHFDDLEKTVKVNEAFALTLTDDAGNPLAGMEIGLWNGSGSTAMTGLTTDVTGSVSLSLDQEGLYCVTAQGTVVETAIDVNTLEQTSIETPIIAPVCVVTVSGVAQQQAAYAAAPVYDAVPADVSEDSDAGIAVAAETDLTWSGGTINLASGTTLGSATLTTLTIYKQGATSTYPTITKVTQDGMTINITLAEDTDLSYPIQLGFAAGSVYVQNSGNTCKLNNGKASATVAVQVKAAPAPNAPVYGEGTFTVNFAVDAGEAVVVTPPDADGITFTGDAAYKDKPYSFKVSVKEGYDGTEMQVSCLSGGESIALTDNGNGNYTIASVPGDITIVVTGVEAKVVCGVTAEAGEGVTVTAPEQVYAGDSCTFTVTVDGAYDAANMVVAVNGDAVDLDDKGSYTITEVTADTKITVSGVIRKTVYTVTLTKSEDNSYTISGQDTSYAGEPYTFTVTVDDAIYWADRVQVKVDGEVVELTEGKYTFAALDGDKTVTVENVVERNLFTVTAPEEAGVDFTGGAEVREGKPYAFSIQVKDTYLAPELVVKINGEPVELTDGSYTVSAVESNLAITVEGVRAKEEYTVTKVVDGGMEAVTINGSDTVLETDAYIFTVTVPEIYNTEQMQVTYRMGETSGTLTPDDAGNYTVSSANGDVTVTVSGLVKNVVFTVTAEGKGFTFTGAAMVYKGADYSFTVTPMSGYTGTAVVKVNGSEITGTDGTYMVQNVSEDLIITVECLILPEVSGMDVPVSDNVVDITNRQLYKRASSIYINATNITVTGPKVTAAYEDGTTVFVMLASDTADDAEIKVTFGTEGKSCSVKGHEGGLTLADGEGALVMNVKGYYSAKESWNSTVTFTLIFIREIPSENPPVRVQESDAKELWGGESWEIDLRSYFTDADTYYLVEGESRIQLPSEYYTFSNATAGVHTLIFAAANESGESADHVTVTVTVKGVECLQESDAFSTYAGVPAVINVAAYFNGASAYYLVEGEARAEVPGGKYTFHTDDAGTYTLVFAAANGAGESPDQVTVTVAVTQLVSGTYIGHTTGNGSMNYVLFKDAAGNLIEGLDAAYDAAARTINVLLPKDYAVNGTVKAVFDLSQNESGYPFISTSTKTTGNGAFSSRFTEKSIGLTNGAAQFTFYYYNANTSATNNGGQTPFSVALKLKNDLPVLAEGVEATAEATITAGQNYSLDLRPVFTDIDNDPLTYFVSINGADAVAADADYSYTTNTAGDYELVFTANDGKDTSTATYTVTLTVENSEETQAMTVSIPEGLDPKFYISSGYGEDGVDQQGAEVTIAAEESADGMTSYMLSYPVNAAALSVRAEGWGGMAFAAEENGAVTLRQVTLTVVDYNKNPAESTNTASYDGHTAASGENGWLLVTGQKYTFQAVPKDISTLTTTSMEETLQEGEGICTLELMLDLKNPITITVPTGAEARLYQYKQYYSNTQFDAKIIRDNGNGTSTFYFVANPNVQGMIYQVCMPGKITKSGYWKYGNYSLTVTYTDTDKADTWRLDDYSATGQMNSSFTEDSVMLNINSRNHLAMSAGQSKTLKAYRVWEVIPVSYNNHIITPEFTYEVLSGDGVVSLSDKNSNSAGEGDWKTLRAIGDGTAVIEVSYKSMEVAGGQYDGTYGATDPARTGLIVVQVGGNDESVNFNIDSFASRGTAGSNNVSYNPNAKRDWDAEFDTLYFTGNNGELKLSPTAANTITQVAVSHNKGISWTALSAQDGVYTAPIVSGNNILRVTTTAGVSYQVVRGDKITVQLSEQQGNGDGKFQPGETVRVALKGLHTPIPKMAGNYNPGYGQNTDGYGYLHLNYTFGEAAVYGPGSQYNFITSANYIDVTIPEDTTDNILYLTDGYIGLAVIGLTQFDVGGDSHRNIPDDGCSTRGSTTTWHTRSVLPEIRLNVAVPGSDVVPVESISLDETAQVEEGKTITLKAVVIPTNATNKTVKWTSSNLTIAMVNRDGVVTGLKPGTVTITAAAEEDSEVKAECQVTVTAAPVAVTGVTLDQTEAAVEVGQSIKLTATVAPAEATNQAVTWRSSNANVASVDSEGNVTGVTSGEATITVTTADGSKTAQCKITVKVPVTGISLEETAEVEAGKTVKLTAVIAPNNATNKAVTWKSSNANIAEVDENGVVTGKAPGKATVTVTTADGSKTAQCEITVKISVTGITLDQETAEVKKSLQITLKATVTPENATNKTVIWTSEDEAIARVDENGVVTGWEEGKTTITATTADGGKTAVCEVTVTQAPVAVTGVTLPETAEVAVDDTVKLTATVLPENADNKNVTWMSSNTNIATVDEAGVVTGKAPGTVTITATTAEGSFTAECTVTVKVPVAGVTLDETAGVEAGKTVQLTAVVIPDNATNKAVTWKSSDEDVATVDENGVVTGVAGGEATITVTTADGGKTAQCKVTVTVPVTGVALDKTKATVEVEKTIALTATVAPENASNQAVTWKSSNENVATVDTEGNVTGVSGGEATITVTTADGSKTAQCKITVIVPVTGVTLDQDAEVAVDQTVQLTATVAPENATNKAVTWASSDETIATVDDKGVVTGKAPGEAIITVTTEDGKKKAECKVTVIIPVTGVTLDATATKVAVNKTVQITATVAPEDASNKSVTWKSSAEGIATVDEDGVVTGKSVGTATITATTVDGSKTAQCQVQVVAVPQNEATVYLSVSHDASFVTTADGSVIALQKLTVPYFDLSLYGLDAYSNPATDEERFGKPTMLHLYIYATEVFLYGVSKAEAGQGYLKDEGYLHGSNLAISGSAGSIFLTNFWGMSENLNYYHNYLYPADENGWGITADDAVLQDGDIVTVGHFTCWEFYSDPRGIFNYLVAGEDTVETTAVQNQEIILKLYRAGKDLGNGGENAPVRESLNIYYTNTDALSSGDVTTWTLLGTTDADGELKVAMPDCGQYILAVAGQKGTTYTKDIVSTPGGIILNVTESGTDDPVKRVIALIDQIDEEITLESETKIETAADDYNALTAAQQKNVTNVQKLLNAQDTLAQLQQTAEDAAKADNVKDLIDDIGDVDLDREEAIVAARIAYEELTERQKTLVGADYLKKLTDAETALQQLQDEVDAVEVLIDAIGEGGLDKESDIAAAREAFDELNDQQKALLGETYQEKLTEAETDLQAQKDEVEALKTMIDAIGEGGLEKENEITQAMEAFDELNEQQQKLLGTGCRQKLTAAKNDLDEQKAEIEEVEDLIEAIGDMTPQSKEDIKEALEAYEALNDAQKARISQNALRSLEEARNYRQLLEISDADILKIYQTTGSYLSGLDAPTVGSINGEWRVIGLARAGRSVADAYYDTVVSYVQDNIDANERLNAGKATENARVILALTAIGKDVTDVGGHNLLHGLNDMTYIRNQGINGSIWTLITLDSHAYTPVGITKANLIDEILDKQLTDGGWSVGTTSEVDMTAMAIQALAPYYDKDSTVKAAVDKALDLLSEMQNANGSFNFDGAPSAESIAQVIVALTALGINPDEDARFVKNGITIIQALAQLYVEGGGFKKGNEFNMMATEQGYYALVSYFRLLEEKTSLYDMSDVTIETSAANQAAANEVIALINAIGNVDLTKEDEINAARTAYNALTNAQKELVTNYATLTAAEHRLADLTGTPEDREKVQEVKDLIDAIGTVTLSKESTITAARSAYNRLTTRQQNLLGSAYLKKLTDAESALADLKQAQADEAAASAVEQKISAIGSTITLGSESKITAARNAYNALTADQKDLVSNYQTLVNAENALSVLKSTVSVTFSLKGCYKHGSGETAVHTLASGNLQTWITAKTYKVQPGATVKDLFEQALTAAGLSWSNPTGNYVESITYNGQTVGEFTNGTNSGWMYTLNGKHPSLGVAQQTLVSGDVVVFHYTDDYTKEEGSMSGGTTTSGTTNYITTTTTQTDAAAAESVERLIEDIGQDITLDSEAKILAARAAYDKLTDAQKKLVEKYDDLVTAEQKLAELKGSSNVDVYAETGDYLQGLGTPGVGSVGGEWMVIGLARSGRTVSTGYYDHVLNYVRDNINEEERLHSAKSSDNSRVILALTAIGKDITNVDGHDLLKGLNSMEYIQKQGINGPIWALIAFDSGNYPVPEGDVSRQKLVDVILEAQLDDGGWAMSSDRADPDLTGMAIQALAPYMASRLDVQKAVEEAVWTLSGIQNDNGSFSSVDGPSSESIAQVIVALAALGIDADTDARFVKNGISALDALLTYFVPGGGFRHVLTGSLDGMATEQAYYALVAYNRMKQNQNSLYDMTDVIDRGGDVVTEQTTEPTEMVTEPAVEEEKDNGNAVVIWISVAGLSAATIVVLLLNRKKLFGKLL